MSNRTLSAKRLLIGTGVTLLALLVLPASASAQNALDAGIGPAKLGDDFFVRLNLGGAVATPALPLPLPASWFDAEPSAPLKVGFYVPLSFRLTGEGDFFRNDEWDEPGEILRTVRWAEIGQRYGAVRLRVGELVDWSVGHSTIMSGYNNSLDLDHFSWGVGGEINTKMGGVELMVGDVVDPSVMGGRVYVRPLFFTGGPSFFDRLAVGASVITDTHAPKELKLEPKRDAAGNPELDAQGTPISTGKYVQDENGDLIVETESAATVMGIDAELPLLPPGDFVLTPYTDLIKISGAGTGLHTGVFFGWQAPANISIGGRAEYRVLGENYLPGYFGPVYGVERSSYLPVTNDLGLETAQKYPKREWLAKSDTKASDGYLTEVNADVMGIVRVQAQYATSADDQATGEFVSRATINAGDAAQIGVYYARSGLSELSEIGDLKDALVVAEAKVPLNSFLYLTAQGNRRWQLDDKGEYQPNDEYSFSVGASLGF